MSKAEEWADKVNLAEIQMQRATERFKAQLPTNAPFRVDLGPDEFDYGTRLTRVNGAPCLEHSGLLAATNALALARWIQEVFEDIPGGH